MPICPIRNLLNRLLLAVCLLLLLSHSDELRGQNDLDAAPIHYLSSEAEDAVAQWIAQQDSTAPTYDPATGWLPEVLRQLEVPAVSQTLVFSKTSLQIRQISPDSPRAIYFNDDVYVGYVPGGNVIELSAIDPQLGAIFYTVDQRNTGTLQIRRENHQCLSCHESAKTKGVPGYLVRSVFPSRSGHPVYSMGTTTTDHATPFGDRFGGWFVSQPWAVEHRGNTVVQEGGSNENVQTQTLPFAEDSSGRTVIRRPDQYLSPHSDLVALLVLEHQTQGHNLITAANWDVRRALDYQRVMNEALDRPADYLSDSTIRRIDRASQKIVDYFLFRDEYPLPAPLPETEFSKRFQAIKLPDGRTDPLRQLDGQKRLFAYPCSFLIRTPAFAQLPPPVRERTLRSIRHILTASQSIEGFEHLTTAVRQQLHQHLCDSLPAYADIAEADDSGP